MFCRKSGGGACTTCFLDTGGALSHGAMWQQTWHAARIIFFIKRYPLPPLQSPALARDHLPGGGGDGRQVTVSQGGGGIARVLGPCPKSSPNRKQPFTELVLHIWGLK